MTRRTLLEAILIGWIKIIAPRSVWRLLEPDVLGPATVVRAR